MRGLVWFRRDLRVHDHPAFAAASQECDELIPLFIFDEPLLNSREFGAACVNFMLGCLRDLGVSLANLGYPLQWRRGNPVHELLSAARAWQVDTVYWNRDYEPAAIQRDRTVQHALATAGLAVRTFKDHVVFESTEIRSATGEPLQRYSAYKARWWTKWNHVHPSLMPDPKPASAPPPGGPPMPLPSAEDLGYPIVTPWIEPGERAARARIRDFLHGPIHRYVDGRNVPAIDGSSKLSPHFRFGTLSPNAAIHAALDSLKQRTRVSRPDVLTWIDELIWREFFHHVLAAFPHVADGPFRPLAIPPSREPGPERDRLFRAWCEGRTGYPIVDAGMRQLLQTGWMHNRVRMVVASFLIKDLRIDWQSGERYFMQHLLDADLAANNGNWQWCASTGTDAMRGYRIFNPVLQSKKFDPDGAYIRAYVPELSQVDTRWIHEPHAMPPDVQRVAGCRVGDNYPSPIVNHGQAREEYLALSRERTHR